MESTRAALAKANRIGMPVAALLAGLAAVSCISPSDPLSHMAALEESQKRYTEAIRWGDFERASQYVEAEMRQDFLSMAEGFEDLRITDYEIGDIDVESDEKRRAEIEVTYLGYALPYYVERKVRDRQVWLRDESLGDRWRVRPALELLIAGFGDHP